jgi:hypothetical protein
MVSFCDLRLTQLSNSKTSIHTTDFGNFGIGFLKRWGFRNGISPVTYVHQNSKATSLIEQLGSELQNKKYKSIRKTIPELIKFVKPYESNYQKGRFQTDKRRHYDEREWRYVPDDTTFPVISNFNYNAKNTKTLNERLSTEFKLSFSNNDVKFIVIDKNTDKDEIIESIKAIDLSQSAVEDLITKIISIEELNEDY